MSPEQTQKLLSALIKYDTYCSKRSGYNVHALGHYCEALGKARKHCNRGVELRDAIMGCFLDRLADRLLKSVGLEKMSTDECQFGVRLPELAE